MAKLSTGDVVHVAKLAKLTVTPKQIDKFKDQLSKVVSHFEVLNEVDTKGVEPTSQTTGLTNIARDDRVTHSQALTVEEALSGTEKVRNGYFVVPAILQKD